MRGNKRALRDGGTLASLGSLSLDITLGLRMLRKYPGLTFVGGLAMAFAIWVGAVVFQVMGCTSRPDLIHYFRSNSSAAPATTYR